MTQSSPALPPTAIAVHGLTKSFGEGDSKTIALKQVNFSARESEMHLVVGPSGCGKTTLLSVIAGTLHWEAGEVVVFGEALHELSTSRTTAFRGKNIGFIFQQFNLISTLTCVENVSVPLLLNGASRSVAERSAAKWMSQVGLGDKLSKRPSQLSGGQQQRVAIARALIHEPRLIICDEPTSALDSVTGQQIMELLAGVARVPGRCVLIVTHDHRTFRFADRITEMEDGRVKAIHEGVELKHYIERSTALY